MKMPAAERFGLRFSLAILRQPATSRGHQAKTQVESRTIRIHRFGPHSRINSCGIPSRVETIIPRRTRVTLITTCGSCEYHYCSINTERRNSENCWSNCGNLAPSISTHFRILLKNKHLDLFQDGPLLANCAPPARVPVYWCPET